MIQLIEGEDNEMITHIIPPEELPEMVTAVPEEKGEQKLKRFGIMLILISNLVGLPITSMDEKHDKSCCEICRRQYCTQ